MTEFKTRAEIEAKLATYVPLSHQITGQNITIGRMYKLMSVLGNPERQLKIIHIAGTSGKTSTTYYIAALLRAAGKKVGMTVSPHIDSVTERLQVNSKPLDEKEFGKAMGEVIDLIKKSGIEPTYFELLVALAYWYFAKIKVDYAVIETGLGGLEDGTNVAEREDKLCVITDIGFDHMQVLGNTLPEIAKQKAGIIHPHNMALTFKQKPEVIKVFQDWCDQEGAKLRVLDPTNANHKLEIKSALNALPEFQEHNWQLAHEAYEYLRVRDKLNMLSIEQLIDTMAVRVPGRMDAVEHNDKTLVMDGAHNGQKMAAFTSSFQKIYPGQKAAVLLSLKQDKQFEEVLPLVKNIADTIILTTFSLAQDRPTHSTAPEELAVTAKAAGFKNIIIESNQDAAYKLLLSQPEKLLVITGSLYLIGQLRRKHEELKYARS